MTTLYAIHIATGEGDPLPRAPGYVFAWLHPDAKRAYTLAVHRDPAGVPGRWKITHVHSGHSCSGSWPLTMPIPSPTPAQVIRQGLQRMDIICTQFGLARMESIFRTAELDPPCPFPVEITHERDAREVSP